ncbi:hypothetical protein J2S30_000781 [Herbaspirillum rubrisubalbicans]|uniref:hypothetical protein n=1 Tax=Herbaspirillum rubrisubalbicans TaxID=80842 RepID=UPI00209FEB0D|nr:hypothetical protein [Herbaspirillum rubrisubalbicans]MCP1572402.1 hypothetical protein [Herbaspirillum rubrisubalbicans]
MTLSCKNTATLLAILTLLALSACSWTSPSDIHTSVGVVQGFIDAQTQVGLLPPCVASHLTQLHDGTRFAVIRYEHWASHFKTTTYAEIPSAMKLQLHQRVEIEPGQCSHDELAVIVQDTNLPDHEGAK